MVMPVAIRGVDATSAANLRAAILAVVAMFVSPPAAILVAAAKFAANRNVAAIPVVVCVILVAPIPAPVPVARREKACLASSLAIWEAMVTGTEMAGAG